MPVFIGVEERTKLKKNTPIIRLWAPLLRHGYELYGYVNQGPNPTVAQSWFLPLCGRESPEAKAASRRSRYFA